MSLLEELRKSLSRRWEFFTALVVILTFTSGFLFWLTRPNKSNLTASMIGMGYVSGRPLAGGHGVTFAITNHSSKIVSLFITEFEVKEGDDWIRSDGPFHQNLSFIVGTNRLQHGYLEPQQAGAVSIRETNFPSGTTWRVSFYAREKLEGSAHLRSHLHAVPMILVHGGNVGAGPGLNIHRYSLNPAATNNWYFGPGVRVTSNPVHE